MTCSCDKLFVETWTSTKVFKLPFSYVKFYFVPCSSTLPHDSSLFLFIWVFLKEPKFCSSFKIQALSESRSTRPIQSDDFYYCFYRGCFFSLVKFWDPQEGVSGRFFFYTPIINNILFGYNGMVATTHYNHYTMRGSNKPISWIILSTICGKNLNWRTHLSA